MTAVLADPRVPASAPPAPTAPPAGRSRPGRPDLRVVVRPAPRREPPFDDELDLGAGAAGPLDQRLPFEQPAGPRLAVCRAATLHGLPEPARWGRRLLVGLIETAGGRRPLNQLASMLSISVGRGLGADFERAAILGTPHWLHRASVHSVRATEPAEGVAELCATVTAGRRVRAVAMRLEEQHGRWRCTRLQLG